MLAVIVATAPWAGAQDTVGADEGGDTIRAAGAPARPEATGADDSRIIDELEDEGESIRVVGETGSTNSVDTATSAAKSASEAVTAIPVTVGPAAPVELASPPRISGPPPLTTEPTTALAPSTTASAAAGTSTTPPRAEMRRPAKAAKGATSVASKGSASDGFSFPGVDFSGGSSPIDIKADKLALDYENKLITWSGHVRATQANGQVTSDRMRVTWGQNFNDVKEMIAEGNVRVSQGTRYATSEQATFDQLNRTVVLTGNPVVHSGRDQITGSKITVFLDTGRSVVEGARAVIFPSSSVATDNETAADGAR
jgi:lipopolysaccharide export system protein LptA